MPSWMVEADFPLKAATSTTPATRYVNTAALNRLLDQFPNWQSNVNAGGYTLSNLGSLLAASASFTGIISSTTSIRLVAASGDLRMMQDANTGFRWLLNNDGTLRLQRTTNNYSAATQPIVFNADSSITIPGALGVGGAITSASADIAGFVGVGLVNSGAARLMVQAGSAGAASLRISDGVNSTIVFDHPSSALARIQVPSGSLKIEGGIYFGTVLPGPYADNAAAVAAGLTAGRLYRDSSNNVKQVQ
jgi:hypothetical protein